jgi:hypothetical protein
MSHWSMWQEIWAGIIASSRNEAAEDLYDIDRPEACFAVGCSSPGTFSTRFTELVGCRPAPTGARRRGRRRGCRRVWPNR